MCHFDQAAVLAESCLEYKLVKKIKDTAPLIEAVFLEYARYFNSLSLLRGMRYYCEKAGEKARSPTIAQKQFIPLLCLYILVHFILSIVGASGKLA